jgi:translin
MEKIDIIASQIHKDLEFRTALRDATLARARSLTRHCANAIRAIHRGEIVAADQHLGEAKELASQMTRELESYHDLYFTGYTQDALKEYAEASIVYALILDKPLPTPGELGLHSATYLQGMAEAVGELRRRCLDILREGHSEDAERLLTLMDEIYTVLVTMDFPDAITGGLRRLTDIVRGVTERTRGDITISIRQEKLEASMRKLDSAMNASKEDGV